MRVVTGPAGHDLYSLYPVEHLGGARPKTLIQLPGPAGLCKGRGQGLRLLVNLLEHVVVVGTQLHHLHRGGNAGKRALHRLAMAVDHL